MNNHLLMTQGEFALRRGVLPSAVSNWKKNELLVFAEGPTGKLMVDVLKTEARLNSKVNSMRGRPSNGVAKPKEPIAPSSGPAPEPVENEASQLRMELARENIQEKRIKNLEKAGELVALAEYERRQTENGRQVRERVMSVVRDMAERLAVETEPRTIVALQQEAFDRMFADLASDIEQGALADEVLAEAEPDDVEAPEEDAV